MRLVVFLASLALTSAAHADTTAVYGNAAAKFTMTIKIAANGDIRGEVPGRTYFYVGGKDYFVDRTGTGVIVMRLDDMAKVMAEQLAEQSAKMGIPSISPPTMTLVRKDTVTVNKWSGDTYYWKPRTVRCRPDLLLLSAMSRLSLNSVKLWSVSTRNQR